jgi:hypothetical protein
VFIYTNNALGKHQPNTTVRLGVFKWQPHLIVAYSQYNSRLKVMFKEILANNGINKKNPLWQVITTA